MRALHVGHPVPDGLGGGILERSCTRMNWSDLGPHEPHAEHVEFLPLHVLGAHVHDALQPKSSTHGGGGHTVLSSTGLGDDALLSNPFGQESLSHCIVNLVSTGVVEIFSFEVDVWSFPILSIMLGELFCKVQGGLPSHVVLEHVFQLFLEGWIGGDLFVGRLQLFQGSNQRLWHVLSSEFTIPTAGVGPLVGGNAAFETVASASFPVHRNASPPFVRSHSFATRRHRHRRRPLASLRRRSHAPGRRLHQGVSPGGAGRRTAGSARHTTHLPGGKTTCARRATRRKRHAHERRRSYTPPKADKGCSYTLAPEPTPTGLDPKEDTWLIVGRIASEGGETRQGKARRRTHPSGFRFTPWKTSPRIEMA
eukprot:scaffold2318_cov363-Pavlova_lutheri.AAC.3